MISRVLTYCFGLLFLIISAVTSSDKMETNFDQTNTVRPLGMVSHNLLYFSPLGQSFTPTLTSLNFVNLLTENGSALTENGSATVKVNIRLGSMSGPVLGTSQPTVIPFSISPGVSSFRFSTSVTLIPGDVYVIEPFVVSGNALIGSMGTNDYVGGDQILGGATQTNNDLWFQEGISVTERRGWLLLGTGLLALLAIVFFKNRSIFHRLKS